MAGFKFRLQSFLNVKQKVEDQKKLEYGKALGKLEEEKNEKIRLEEEQNQAVMNFRNSIEASINPQEFQSYNRYLELMKKRIRDQIILIDMAEKTVEKKRLELVESMKERKMLDVLKENDKVEYMKEEQKAEQKIVDEIVSYQYNNKA